MNIQPRHLKVSIIAAIAKNNVIGCKGKLPWDMPADLAHFKELTLDKTVIMGRQTYESIGKPLPQRKNIIVTRNLNFKVAGCQIVCSLEEAIAKNQNDELMIIGGADLYQQALPLANNLYLTFIDAEVNGDTFFPQIDWKKWQEVAKEKHLADTNNPYNYCFIKFIRDFKL
jgi:dihydrofolate reductase